MSQKDRRDPISGGPVSGHAPRTSEVVFPRNEEPSSPRPRTELPAEWADRLLRVAWETPLESGDVAVVVEMLSALAELLPAFAVGATFATGEDADEPTTYLVARKHPASEVASEVVTTAGRVFPELAHESSVSVPTDYGPVTLCIASDAHAAIDESSLAMSVLRRAILLLARNLDSARARALGQSDVQAKKVLVAQMVQVDKLASLGQIAAGIVHELNNPLTSIVAYSEYLVKRWLSRRDEVDPHELERLQRISDSADRLLRFTRDLVTYARPATSAWMPISLHGVIDQAVMFCEHLLSENKTTVVRSFDEQDHAVRGSPEQLTQVFVNLLTNACQAMAQGGTVTVATEIDLDGHGVRIMVQDAGHGIEPAHLGQVFSPFFTTKPAGRGTGLGLSIVKSIIDAHQGRIWAESEPAQGARFLIVLPRA